MTVRFKVIICRGPECGDARGSKVLHAGFQTVLAARGLDQVVELGWQSCFGRCTQGPNVLVTDIDPRAPRRSLASMPVGRPGRSALYNGCTTADIVEIVDQHIVAGAPVRRLIAPIAPRHPIAAAPAPLPAPPMTRRGASRDHREEGLPQVADPGRTDGDD